MSYYSIEIFKMENIIAPIVIAAIVLGLWMANSKDEFKRSEIYLKYHVSLWLFWNNSSRLIISKIAVGIALCFFIYTFYAYNVLSSLEAEYHHEIPWDIHDMYWNLYQHGEMAFQIGLFLFLCGLVTLIHDNSVHKKIGLLKMGDFIQTAMRK